jgi:hypothetical protein
MSPVKYKLDFYIPANGTLDSQRRGNIKSYRMRQDCQAQHEELKKYTSRRHYPWDVMLDIIRATAFRVAVNNAVTMRAAGVCSSMLCFPPPQSASSVKKVALICLPLFHGLSSVRDLVKGGKKSVPRRLPEGESDRSRSQNKRKSVQTHETLMTSI